MQPKPGNGGPSHRVTVPDHLTQQRLDRVLATLLPDLSRSKIQRLIANGHVVIDEAPAAKASLSVDGGQQITVSLPKKISADEPRSQDLNLDIVYEDDDLAVVNKPAGLVVHSGAGQHKETLVNGLLHRYGETLSRCGGDDRPGIVHRLDKGTSGIMALARHDAAHAALAHQFATRTVEKQYDAVVYGCPRESSGEVDLAIGRDRANRTKISPNTDRPRDAFTRWELIEDLGGFALLSLWPKTGRMHQVRAHLEALHHPCVGDLKYGGAQWKSVLDGRVRRAIRDFARPALHSCRLRLDHPVSRERLEFVARLPADLEELLGTLRCARDKP
jgi:23S rRNA pseudouridine1911/1915/1917 synthase